MNPYNHLVGNGAHVQVHVGVYEIPGPGQPIPNYRPLPRPVNAANHQNLPQPPLGGRRVNPLYQAHTEIRVFVYNGNLAGGANDEVRFTRD